MQSYSSNQCIFKKGKEKKKKKHFLCDNLSPKFLATVAEQGRKLFQVALLKELKIWALAEPQ